MEIDRKKPVTKIIGIVTAVFGLYELIFNIVNITAFLGIAMAVVNLLIAFMYFKSIGKDKEFCIGKYGLLILIELINTFFINTVTLSGTVTSFLRIIGYAAIILYVLKILHKKLFPIIGGVVVCGLFLYNTIKLIIGFLGFFSGLSQIGNPGINLIISAIMTCTASAIYVMPALAMVILILCNAVKIENIENNNDKTNK